MSGRCALGALLLKKVVCFVQLEEELSPDLHWVIRIKQILHSSQSKFQKVELADSGAFQKVIISIISALFMTCVHERFQNVKNKFSVHRCCPKRSKAWYNLRFVSMMIDAIVRSLIGKIGKLTSKTS